MNEKETEEGLGQDKFSFIIFGKKKKRFDDIWMITVLFYDILIT